MMVRAATVLSSRQRLGIILGVALALRLAILPMTSHLGLQIVDERHYHVLATSIVEGRGFVTQSGPTSLRPPVYPALVAALWAITGSRSLQLVRFAQDVVGLATAAIVFLIGRRLYDDRVGLIASAVTAFYPALVAANSLFLTETVFTFLLTAFLAALVSFVERPRPMIALAVGTLLGLSALTRSIVWPLPIVLVPVLAGIIPTTMPRRVAYASFVLASYAAVVAPWAVRNTRLQGVPVVVDTMGGMNLRMGNYEFTPHDRIWDAVSMTGYRSWIVGIPETPPDGGAWTEGKKERWARGEAVQYMLAHPGLTLWRAVIKFSDFWALDRDFAAAIQRGLFHPPLWAAIVSTAAMTLAFPLVVGLAVIGACLAPPADWRSHLLLILLVLFVTALHSVVFGHPRYRLPLTPVLAIYAGAAVSSRAWHRLREGWRVSLLPATLALALAAIWTTQFIVRDWPFVRQLLGVTIS